MLFLSFGETCIEVNKLILGLRMCHKNKSLIAVDSEWNDGHIPITKPHS